MAIGMLEVALQQSVPLPGASSFAHPDRLQKYLEILREQCDQELELVNNLLDLQRLEADRIQVNLAPIQVIEWTSNMAAAFEGRMQERQQHLQVFLPNDFPPLISDMDILTSVFRELLTNACKYTPAGETITVSVCLAPAHLQLKVSNSGVQIDREELEHIFDKFYRIPGGDPWKQGGTGLGLALIKKQVEYLGGTIEVESNELGVHFVVSLPMSPN
jgi:signal transduction histidine kinase